MEYLVSMTTHVPDGTSEESVAEVRAREAAHTREPAAQVACGSRLATPQARRS
jgi:muconolactone delta-isomerase